MSLSSPADLQPHILCRPEAEVAECALWRLSEGHLALALFTGIEAAERYRLELPGGGDWQAVRPDEPALLEIFSQCRERNIRMAVLDPEKGAGKRLFDLQQILDSQPGQS